jgi:DNA invertase Pin-like site-specific DNA recombinase
MTIYLYGRVSSTDQAADMKTSLQLQRDACWRIASYHDWKDAVWIEDAGVSGSVPIDERPAGSVLIKALQPADTLIVAKLDRAFRSALDALQIAEQFRKASISLIIADIGTDPVT